MVSVQEKDRDSLKFLWICGVNGEKPDVIVLRFTRVVFGVNSSPFLLNATIDHHMRKYQEIDPLLTNFSYVDDVSLGSGSGQCRIYILALSEVEVTTCRSWIQIEKVCD